MMKKSLIPLCFCLTIGAGHRSSVSKPTVEKGEKICSCFTNVYDYEFPEGNIYLAKGHYSIVQYCSNPNLLVSVEFKNASLLDILQIVDHKYGGLLYGVVRNLRYPSKITLSVKNVTLRCLLYEALRQEKTKKIRLMATKALQWDYFTNLGFETEEYSSRHKSYVDNEALSFIF